MCSYLHAKQNYSFPEALDNKDETSTCQRRLTKKDEKITEMILSTSADFIDRSEDVIF